MGERHAIDTARGYAAAWLDRAFGYESMRRDAGDDRAQSQLCAVMGATAWAVAVQFLEVAEPQDEGR